MASQLHDSHFKNIAVIAFTHIVTILIVILENVVRVIDADADVDLDRQMTLEF